MSHRIPMSLAAVAAVTMSLGLSKEAKANEITPPASAPESVLNLSAEDMAQLNQMGFDPQTAEQDVQAIQAEHGVSVRDLQRQVSQDMQNNAIDITTPDNTDQYRIESEYMDHLRERFETRDGDPDKVRVVLAESREGDEQLRLKGLGIRYTREF